MSIGSILNRRNDDSYVVFIDDGPSVKQIEDALMSGQQLLARQPRTLIFYGDVTVNRPKRWWSWMTRPIVGSLITKRVELVCWVKSFSDEREGKDNDRLIELVTKPVEGHGELRILYFPDFKAGFCRLSRHSL